MQVPRYLLTKKSEPFTWSMLRTLTSVARPRYGKLYQITQHLQDAIVVP